VATSTAPLELVVGFNYWNLVHEGRRRRPRERPLRVGAPVAFTVTATGTVDPAPGVTCTRSGNTGSASVSVIRGTTPPTLAATVRLSDGSQPSA
jgi:hypothetical protein